MNHVVDKTCYRARAKCARTHWLHQSDEHGCGADVCGGKGESVLHTFIWNSLIFHHTPKHRNIEIFNIGCYAAVIISEHITMLEAKNVCMLCIFINFNYFHKVVTFSTSRIVSALPITSTEIYLNGAKKRYQYIFTDKRQPHNCEMCFEIHFIRH